MSWQDCMLGDVITLKRGHDLPEKIGNPAMCQSYRPQVLLGTTTRPKLNRPALSPADTAR